MIGGSIIPTAIIPCLLWTLLISFASQKEEDAEWGGGILLVEVLTCFVLYGIRNLTIAVKVRVDWLS